ILMDLVLSDAGLAAGALAVSPVFRVPPAAIGIVSIYGAGGAALFSLAAALFTGNQSSGHPIAVANVAGTMLGLAIGALRAANWHRGLYGGADEVGRAARRGCGGREAGAGDRRAQDGM